MAQRRALIAGRGAACGYPTVVAELKLTPIQLRQLLEGAPAANVLGKGQSDTLDNFLAAKFDFTKVAVVDPIAEKVGGLKQRVEPKTVPDAKATFAQTLLTMGNRLELTEAQRKKLAELAEDEPKFFDLIQREMSFAEAMPVAGAGRGLTPASAAAEQYREAAVSQCLGVLDERQRSLAKQLLGRRR